MKTDTELKLALAKMLPERIALDKMDMLYWRDSLESVQDTELLHVCWLVEQTIDIGSQQAQDYLNYLPRDWWQFAHATWQQRAEALCKVKGIE